MRGRRETNEPAAARDFDALYRRLYPQLLRASYAITLDLEVAREITHEAFLRLWERRDRLAADSNEKAWLMRVATNLALSHRRGVLVRRRHSAAQAIGADPAAVALARIEGDAMRQALRTLQPYERAVLDLRYQQDLSFLEIGELLGRPEATVRTSCHRALEKLHRHLDVSTVARPVAKVSNDA